jgi:GTP-binding protein
MPNPKKSSSFKGGALKLSDLNRLNLGDKPRIAVAGRSNVGKSTLLNALLGARLARVSKSPGKTREINFFSCSLFGKQCWLVDLPGYGYANVPLDLKDEWGREVTSWLNSDPYLIAIIVLIDGRHGFLEHDLRLINFLKSGQLPIIVAFTKMDKWKSNTARLEACEKLSAQAKNNLISRFTFIDNTKGGTVAAKAIRLLLKELLA